MTNFYISHLIENSILHNHNSSSGSCSYDGEERLGSAPLVNNLAFDVVENDVDLCFRDLHGHEPLAIVVQLELLRIWPAHVAPPRLGSTSTSQELNRTALDRKDNI